MSRHETTHGTRLPDIKLITRAPRSSVYVGSVRLLFSDALNTWGWASCRLRADTVGAVHETEAIVIREPPNSSARPVWPTHTHEPCLQKVFSALDRGSWRYRPLSTPLLRPLSTPLKRSVYVGTSLGIKSCLKGVVCRESKSAPMSAYSPKPAVQFPILKSS
eukprot:6054269-Pleurochrysis_carterae.AAC.2